VSLEALSWAFSLRGPRLGDRLVILVLADYADQRHSCFPSMRLIAERAELSMDAARVCIGRLEDAGLVKRVERRRAAASNRSNLYYLNAPNPQFDEDEVDPFGEARTGTTPPPDKNGGTPPDKNGGTSPRPNRGVKEPPLHNPQLNHHSYGAKHETPMSSPNQIEWLCDLHVQGGGELNPHIKAAFARMTYDEADAEINDALALLPRGKNFIGDPESPDLSPKGRERAVAKLIPGAKGNP